MFLTALSKNGPGNVSEGRFGFLWSQELRKKEKKRTPFLFTIGFRAVPSKTNISVWHSVKIVICDIL